MRIAVNAVLMYLVISGASFDPGTAGTHPHACFEDCKPRVLSLNLAAKTDAKLMAQELRDRLGTMPDILLLQEVSKVPGSDLSVAEQLAKLLDFHAVFDAPKPGPTNIGLAILSRWPLSDKTASQVRSFYKVLRYRPRMALGVTAH
ncbi:MAG TPA: endonuclease/exonuclease/phosphatase family protein, partial [Bryobacteraceae bacterium]|nr:endonuclease/exonuclease/phosphatase family protein [Bryobacteraceae bacterium]